jgi:hypothetical protein
VVKENVEKDAPVFAVTYSQLLFRPEAYPGEADPASLSIMAASL